MRSVREYIEIEGVEYFLAIVRGAIVGRGWSSGAERSRPANRVKGIGGETD